MKVTWPAVRPAWFRAISLAWSAVTPSGPTLGEGLASGAAEPEAAAAGPVMMAPVMASMSYS